MESDAGNLDRATELLRKALALYRKLGSDGGVAICMGSLAGAGLRAGRTQEARDLLREVAGYAASSGDTEFLADILEVAACTAAGLGDRLRAARLAGAAEGIRQQVGIPRSIYDEALLERFLVPARAATAPGMWDAELAAGRALSGQQAAELLRSAAQRA